MFQGFHSASMPGILALDVCLRDTSRVVTGTKLPTILITSCKSFIRLRFVCVSPSGGNDKSAVVFNKDTEQVIAILQGHSKKVTSVIYHPEEVSVLTTTTLLLVLHKTSSFRN